VGTSTRDWVWSSVTSTHERHGIPYAAVFPEPDGASAITSRPSRRGPIDLACTGDGRSNPIAAMPLRTPLLIPSMSLKFAGIFVSWSWLWMLRLPP